MEIEEFGLLWSIPDLFSLGSLHLFSLSWSFSFFLSDFSQMSHSPWLSKYWDEDIYVNMNALAPGPLLWVVALTGVCVCARELGGKVQFWRQWQLPQLPKLMVARWGGAFSEPASHSSPCPSPTLLPSLASSSFFSLVLSLPLFLPSGSWCGIATSSVLLSFSAFCSGVSSQACFALIRCNCLAWAEGSCSL